MAVVSANYAVVGVQDRIDTFVLKMYILECIRQAMNSLFFYCCFDDI